MGVSGHTSEVSCLIGGQAMMSPSAIFEVDIRANVARFIQLESSFHWVKYFTCKVHIKLGSSYFNMSAPYVYTLLKTKNLPIFLTLNRSIFA